LQVRTGVVYGCNAHFGGGWPGRFV
jgi:hypothetical protein